MGRAASFDAPAVCRACGAVLMPRASGWYVLIRESDAAVSCAYYDADLRQWQFITKHGALPAGWKVGARVDEALDAWIAMQAGLPSGPAAKPVHMLAHETRKGREP